jgi:hypothetical protein
VGPSVQVAPGVAVPKTRPQPLRPLVLQGNRDVLIFLECRSDGVIVCSTRKFVPLEALGHSPDHNPLTKAVRELAARRQSMVPAGEPPLRLQIRFLVRRDAGRTLQDASLALVELRLPLTQYALQPEDDVSAITAGR